MITPIPPAAFHGLEFRKLQNGPALFGWAFERLGSVSGPTPQSAL